MWGAGNGHSFSRLCWTRPWLGSGHTVVSATVSPVCKELTVQCGDRQSSDPCRTQCEAVTLGSTTERSRVLRESVRRGLTRGEQAFHEAEMTEETVGGVAGW